MVMKRVLKSALGFGKVDQTERSGHVVGPLNHWLLIPEFNILSILGFFCASGFQCGILYSFSGNPLILLVSLI